MNSSQTYTLPVGQEDQLRLQALNNICNPFTFEFFHKQQISLAGKIVADIGCGTGIMAIEWAKQVGSTGKVYAIDISQAQLDIAKSQADALGLTNIEYLCQPVDTLQELAITADLVYSRFLLEHLVDPLIALQQMQSIVAPGSYLFCENITSYEALFCDPASDAFNRWKEAVLLQPKLHNTDFYIGQKLFSLFKSLAIEPLNFEIRQPLITDKTDKYNFLLGLDSQVLQKKYVDNGFYNSEEIKSIADNILIFSQTYGILAFPQYIQIIGKR